jgi:tetratricopeptide (TPR) repeat protein
MNAIFSSLRSKLCLLLLIALVLRVDVVRAQAPEAESSSSQARIAQDLQSIRTAEQQHLPPFQQAALWVQLALEYHLSTEFPKAEDAYLRALHLLGNAPSARADFASTLDNLSALYLIYGRLDDAERVRKQAIKVCQKLGNPAECGASEVHMADIALLRRDYKKAERIALHGLQMMESSSSPPRTGILSAFMTLAFARCSRGICEVVLVIVM